MSVSKVISITVSCEEGGNSLSWKLEEISK